LFLRAFSDHVQFALQRVLGHARRAAHEELLDIGLARPGHAPDGRSIDRGVPPPEHAETLLTRNALEDPLAEQALPLLNGQKRHRDAVFARRRQLEPSALARKKLVRDLNRDSGSVAGLRIASAGAAMGQIDQNLDSLGYNVVRL